MKRDLLYRGCHFPPQIISHAVWLYLRFTLSLRDVEELLAQPEQNNTQYLLDQVSRLTAENAMLKEKWLTKKDDEEEDMLEESGYNRSDWWG